jgi:2-polyprenyl-6-hydroxyphenyl methylase/3-demethylubiquinone-9 3-methyltransferase
MKRLVLESSWPSSWKDSYAYDLQEVYGKVSHRGYANAYRDRRQATLDLITDVLPAGARILDVAAAQGNFSLTLAEMGYEVTWNDLRADLAGYVRLKHDRGTLHFAPGNVFDLGFDEEFDAALITEVIEHVAHPDEFLRQTARFVKPGGYVVMSTPNGRYFRNTLPKFSECADPARFEAVQFKPNADGHIFLLHPDEIDGLADRAGLEVDTLMFFTNPLTHGHLKTEALLHLLPAWTVRVAERVSRRLPARIRETGLVQMAARFSKPRARAKRASGTS